MIPSAVMTHSTRPFGAQFGLRERRPGRQSRRHIKAKAGQKMRSRSCIIDVEAVACGDDGIALFERIRYRRFDSSVFMYAFDLIELTVTTSDANRSNGASQRWSVCWLVQGPVCSSTSPGKGTPLKDDILVEWR